MPGDGGAADPRSLRGEPGTLAVYRLDLGRLAGRELDRLVAFLAETFGDDIDVVRDALAVEGVAILAEDVEIAGDEP